MFDAILFHTAEPFQLIHAKPNIRKSEQLYVFALQESPAHTKHDLSDELNFYNMTMTYRLDSDIIWPYNYIQDIKTSIMIAPNIKPLWRTPTLNYTNDNLLKLINRKKIMGAWFVSHCQTLSGRHQVIKKLQSYFQIDIFGKCGKFKCPYRSEKCNQLLDNNYKFYFSLENSLCTDYVTEKLFNAMQRNIIPVVFGGADYNRFAPPHSYIDVQQFTTIKELAEYLIFLNDHPNEYIQYFWWKEYYIVTEKSPFCDLCVILNNPAHREKLQIYKNIQEWWIGHSCSINSTITDL